MHRHFCTLFDSAYAAKGLVLHESLLRHSSEPFTLHILTMDSGVFWMLDVLQLPHVKLIPLDAFEYAMHMETVRASRRWQEYCWSAASSLMCLVLQFPNIDAVTYLDADLWFMSDPKVVFDEIGGCSISIVPHRFIQSKRYLEINGTFNVSWVTFRNNDVGQRCAARWQGQVRDWCYNRVEPGHACGDQLYLNEFPDLYGDECHIIQNIGANLAPWNLANYHIHLRDQRVYADDTPAVFFHAHEFMDERHLTNYELRPEDMLIYDRYVDAWQHANARMDIAKKTIALRHDRQKTESERA